MKRAHISSEAIVQAIVAEKLNIPIMENNWRGEYVEQLVLQALGSGFRHLGGDWAGWDIEQETGLRIEVKQSAARQTWTGDDKPFHGRFDISPRKGRYEGAKWVSEQGRAADLYVFAWHGVTDPAVADHRDPEQWIFRVVPSTRLPLQKTIAQSVLANIWPAVTVKVLRAAVLRYASLLGPGRWRTGADVRLGVREVMPSHSE